MDRMSFQREDLTGISKDESKTSGVYLKKEKRRKSSIYFSQRKRKAARNHIMITPFPYFVTRPRK